MQLTDGDDNYDDSDDFVVKMMSMKASETELKNGVQPE
jgi:hypothetical protein